MELPDIPLVSSVQENMYYLIIFGEPAQTKQNSRSNYFKAIEYYT